MTVAAMAVRRPMTYEEDAALPNDGRRYELVNGELIVAAPPNAKHLLAKYSEYDAVQPDRFFVRRERLWNVQLDHMTDAPDLTSESSSPSNRRHDLVTKAAIYAGLGLRECWILDPVNEAMLVSGPP